MRRKCLLFLIAAIWFVGSARAEEVEVVPAGDVKSESLRIILGEPAPVVVWNRTITVFRASLEESTPAARAQRAITRIEALAAREIGRSLPPRQRLRG